MSTTTSALAINTTLKHRDLGARDKVQGAVVWLHGLGASADDFVPLVPYLRAPHLRFFFPQAPDRAVTVNRGLRMPAWYDIRTIGRGPERENEADIDETTRLLNPILEQLEAQGVPSERIVLAGFSQGAAMTLHVGLRYPRRLGGLLVLSGYLLLPGRLNAEATAANATTPILFCHGSRDPVVPIAAGRGSFELLAERGQQLQWRDYPMGHEVCDEQIDDIRNWLTERLPEQSSHG
ncbi:MAG: carboxylesterase [Rickettsiales bacterium]|nr:carboxylesterase [Rickettsiales bacterium]|tara:strand:- start:4554 stop:5261 length:708 start_codon:yes stop_codon:yes gene_type:complete